MTWYAAGENPMIDASLIVVSGRLLRRCRSVNVEEGMVDVDVSVPVLGKEPELLVSSNDYVTHRLKLPFDLRSRALSGSKLYWAGDHWLDETSQRVVGPEVEKVEVTT